MISNIVRILKDQRSAALFSKVLSALLTFVFMWSIARILSPEDAGVFLYTYSIMMILIQLARAGTAHSLVKALSRDITKSSANAILNNMNMYVAVVSVGLIALMLSIVYLDLLKVYIPDDNKTLLYSFLIVVGIFSISQNYGSYFQSKAEVYRQYWAMNIGIVLLATLASGFIFIKGYSVSSLFFSKIFLLISLVVLVSCYLFFKHSASNLKDVTEESLPPEMTGFFPLVTFTLPFAVLALVDIVAYWGGQLLAGGWLSEVELGVLSVCVRLAVLISFVFIAFNTLLAPKISRLHAESKEDEIYKCVVSHTAISSVHAILTTFIFVFFGREILGMFGPTYTEGYFPLVILSVSYLIRVLLGPGNTILIMTNHVRESRKNLIVSALVSIGLGVFLIPAYHVMGVMLSMAIACVLLNTMNHFSVKKLLGISFFNLQGISDQVKFLIDLLSRVLRKS